MAKHGVDSVVLQGDGMLTANSDRLSALAINQRMAFVAEAPFASSGGLIGYGPNYSEMFRRAVFYVDRVLKGTKPEDLPVEQPAKFDFIINQKTAKLLDIALPAIAVVRTTELIE
jgi:putative ABC transport system substrate-binding protein